MSGLAFAAASGARRSSQSARIINASGAAARLCLDLRGTPFADVAVSGIVGEGRRCVAFAARSCGRDLVLKAYHPRAAARHARRCGISIARYEFERNAAFHRVPRLAAHVAAPIGFLSSPGAELFLQERVFGVSLKSFLRDCSEECRGALLLFP